jgi:hypothetical protein
MDAGCRNGPALETTGGVVMLAGSIGRLPIGNPAMPRTAGKLAFIGGNKSIKGNPEGLREIARRAAGDLESRDDGRSAAPRPDGAPGDAGSLPEEVPRRAPAASLARQPMQDARAGCAGEAQG